MRDNQSASWAQCSYMVSQGLSREEESLNSENLFWNESSGCTLAKRSQGAVAFHCCQVCTVVLCTIVCATELLGSFLQSHILSIQCQSCAGTGPQFIVCAWLHNSHCSPLAHYSSLLRSLLNSSPALHIYSSPPPGLVLSVNWLQCHCAYHPGCS